MEPAKDRADGTIPQTQPPPSSGVHDRAPASRSADHRSPQHTVNVKRGWQMTVNESRIMVRDKEAADQAWVEQLLSERWGGHLVLLRDDLIDAATLPALIAGDHLSLATFTVSGGTAELVTLDAVDPSRGIGTALVESPVGQARRPGRTATRHHDQRQPRRTPLLSAPRVSSGRIATRRNRARPSTQAIDTSRRPLRHPDPRSDRAGMRLATQTGISRANRGIRLRQSYPQGDKSSFERNLQ